MYGFVKQMREVTLAIFNFQQQRSVPIPAELRTILEEYLEITSGQKV